MARLAFEHLCNPNQERLATRGEGMRTYTYDDALPVDATFDPFGGLQLLVRCRQPASAQKLTLTERKDWWTQSKRLQAGGLVCVVDATGSLLYCVVSSSTKRTKEDITASNNIGDAEKKPQSRLRGPP